MALVEMFCALSLRRYNLKTLDIFVPFCFRGNSYNNPHSTGILMLLAVSARVVIVATFVSQADKCSMLPNEEKFNNKSPCVNVSKF